MRRVVDLPGGWTLWADDEARPLLVHVDGRRLEPKAAAQEACAEDLYRSLKLEEDKRGRTSEGHETTREFATILSARLVLGYFIRQIKMDQRVIRERERVEAPPGFGEDGGVKDSEDVEIVDLHGRPITAGVDIPLDEDPEAFLDEELDKAVRIQQQERAKLWTPNN